MPSITLARNLSVTETVYGVPAEFVGDHVLGLTVVNLTAGTVNIRLEWSNDAINWSTETTWTTIGFGSSSLGPIEGLAAGYIRVVVSPNDIPANVIIPSIDALVWPAEGLMITQYTSAPVEG